MIETFMETTGVKLNIFVGLHSDQTPAQLQLGDAVAMTTGFGTWLLQEGETALPKIAAEVAAGRLRSAYIGAGKMPPEKPWLAVEWHSRLVSDPEVAWRVQELLPAWSSEPAHAIGVVIFSVKKPEIASGKKSQSPSLVTRREPLWWDVDVEDAKHDPVGWFGEFGRDDVGGWVTFLSAAIKDDERRATVGNLAALGLKLRQGADSLWAVRASGAIKVTALGMRREQALSLDFGPIGTEDPPFDLSPLSKSDADYCVALTIEAPVDPKVIIGPGTVFEQLGPGTTQNLAVAQEWYDTIDAGQLIATVLPAWCINQSLSAPSGEPLRLTPFAFVGDISDQSAVWRDIGRRREAASRT